MLVELPKLLSQFAVLLLLASYGSTAVASNHLKHTADGPLNAGDFRATPPDPLPTEGGVTIKAESNVGLVRDSFTTHDPEITTNPDGTKTVKVTAKSVGVRAEFDRSKSWNADPTNKDLLDHEQGHMDLAEQQARKAQAEYDKKVKDGSLQGTDKTPKNPTNEQINEAIDRATAKLTDAVDAIYDKHSAALEGADEKYDGDTDHGDPNNPAQKTHRDAQKKALAAPNTDGGKKKGPEADSRSGQSLHFDAATGLLTLDSDFVVGFDALGSAFVADPLDPLLGALVVFPDFQLRGGFDDGRVVFGALAPTPQISLRQGADDLFTTGFDYLIYDPALNLFYGLGGSFDLLTGASAFLNAMTQQLIAAEPALFGIEIRPDADFYALSGAFTENAASAFENGLGARSLIPLPNALALCLLGLALMRAAPARRVAGR